MDIGVANYSELHENTYAISHALATHLRPISGIRRIATVAIPYATSNMLYQSISLMRHLHGPQAHPHFH